MNHFSLSSYVRFELQNKLIAREALTRIIISLRIFPLHEIVPLTDYSFLTDAVPPLS